MHNTNIYIIFQIESIKMFMFKTYIIQIISLVMANGDNFLVCNLFIAVYTYISSNINNK